MAAAAGAGAPASFLSLEPQLQSTVQKKVRRARKNRVAEVSGAPGGPTRPDPTRSDPIRSDPFCPDPFRGDAAVVPRRRC